MQGPLGEDVLEATNVYLHELEAGKPKPALLEDVADDFAIFYDCEDEGQSDRFHDCREPPEQRHPISDKGDCPSPKTEPCRHMTRTFKTSRILVIDAIGAGIHMLR